MSGLYKNQEDLDQMLEGSTYSSVLDLEEQISGCFDTIRGGGSDKAYLYELLDLREATLQKLGFSRDTPFKGYGYE